MIALQCVFYASLGLLLGCFARFVGRNLSLHLMFSDMEVRFRDPSGKCMAAIFITVACFSGVALWRVVKRTKQCLDFSCTLYFWHFVACMLYNFSFPTSGAWWVVILLSIALSTIIGEFLCMKSEMREIPLGV
ncbi:Integral membrane protein of the Golgi [Cichlidogyrus casuarinus]|uniref:Integral membrane protein of the Golgi n=1 Tax=Cichlidogyrus casuarinus TaxID=1844966 RepID=A0ABD2PLM1_9PLAT